MSNVSNDDGRRKERRVFHDAAKWMRWPTCCQSFKMSNIKGQHYRRYCDCDDARRHDAPWRWRNTTIMVHDGECRKGIGLR